MNSYEVPSLLEDELPEIKDQLKDTSLPGNINATMLLLARHTRKMMTLHDVPGVVNCMSIVDKIYEKGNTIVKNAVENVFVYAFSGIRACCDRLEWSVIQAKMPITLHSIYIRQIYRSGI